MSKRFLFHLPNDMRELMQLAERIRQLDEYEALEAKSKYILDLALEEMATNIIKYGYDTPGERAIEIAIDFGEEELVLSLCDDGREFNPLECDADGLEDALSERPIGGVGVYLIRNMVQSMQYRRLDGRNELTIHIERG